jgi:ribosomal protein L11 methyltransferase
VIPSQGFDIILANINRNVILQYMPHLKEAIKPSGQILFSGLMAPDKEAIVSSAEGYELVLHQTHERQGWISLLFVNTT